MYPIIPFKTAPPPTANKGLTKSTPLETIPANSETTSPRLGKGPRRGAKRSG